MWKTPKHVNDSAHAMVAPEHLTNVLEQLNSLNLGVSTLIDDVQQWVTMATAAFFIILKEYGSCSVKRVFNACAYSAVSD